MKTKKFNNHVEQMRQKEPLDRPQLVTKRMSEFESRAEHAAESSNDGATIMLGQITNKTRDVLNCTCVWS